MAYHNLAAFGWTLGVHKAPSDYQHPWLVVFSGITHGYWNRADAREAWRLFGGRIPRRTTSTTSH